MTTNDIRPARIDARVIENRDEGGTNRRLVLRVSDWPLSQPGQFVMVSPGAQLGVEESDPLLPRPMAIYRVRRDAGEIDLEILYKISGRGTKRLAAALAGQRVRVVGPLGRGFPIPDARPGLRPVLVGGGTGIASLFDLAVRMAGCQAEPGDVTVLLGGRTESDLLGREDFLKIGVALVCATEDGSMGTRGRVTDLLVAQLAETREAVIYACGPTAMMQRCSEIAETSNARCIVSLENSMACGFGVCLGCAAPVGGEGYRLVCSEGPVFEADSVRWQEMP